MSLFQTGGAVHDTDLAANSQLDIEMSVTDNFDEYFMADPLKEKIQKRRDQRRSAR